MDLGKVTIYWLNKHIMSTHNATYVNSPDARSQRPIWAVDAVPLPMKQSMRKVLLLLPLLMSTTIADALWQRCRSVAGLICNYTDQKQAHVSKQKITHAFFCNHQINFGKQKQAHVKCMWVWECVCTLKECKEMNITSTFVNYSSWRCALKFRPSIFPTMSRSRFEAVVVLAMISVVLMFVASVNHLNYIPNSHYSTEAFAP